ncbi:ABC transporter, ATP-binding protein [Ancylostoma duodenale]|uniref:ABC transporter, ATP-binding protein n=1 Tax=Ancylostoma duodenale TaxID=51022 RepID=A0A0C2CZ22_9BILA|nr:ABC transporter, ATP-binding protein [Ancylostoma duodenale]
MYTKSSMSESLGPDALESQRLLPREVPEEKILAWMDIEATVPMIGKSAKARRRPVLRQVSGVALPREVLAIMGSSGAGKTTLMNILAFQSSKEVESNGAVLVNGKAMTKYEMRRMSAYVQQIDLFCGTLTVKEQLMYSALLRMGNKYSHKEKMEKVEEAIKDMNLFECQDSIIGIPNRSKGISVGEKKRLAFASEILTDPAILFCDEPTSGLDAFMAHQVVTALRLMADKGKTVVTVIHQPGSQIFTMFHRVCFMALGKTAYHGTVKDLIKFFASLGDPNLRVPESYNPADHVIAKLSVSKDTSDEDVERVEVVLFITAMFHESIMGDELRELIWAGSTKLETRNEEEHERHKHRYAVSIWTQMNVLFRRAFLTTIRDPVLLQVRILQVVFKLRIHMK